MLNHYTQDGVYCVWHGRYWFADTNAVTVVNNALQTYERLGSPEGEIALAGAVVYLAVTNKSNALELAYGRFKEFINCSFRTCAYSSA